MKRFSGPMKIVELVKDKISYFSSKLIECKMISYKCWELLTLIQCKIFYKYLNK